jgi:hypothetical protein
MHFWSAAVLTEAPLTNQSNHIQTKFAMLQGPASLFLWPIGPLAHGLRNELTGSEWQSQNGLFEGKQSPFSQQGDQYDKYRRFCRDDPDLV